MQKKIKLFFSTPIVYVFVLGIFAFWQAAFLYSGLHWDMLDIHFPWLYYMSEALQSGELHYWNPYQQSGYPFHADLQVTPWYPFALFVARFIGFNLCVLHYYFLFHLLIAGWGMYKLCKFLFKDEIIVFVGAVMYMLSGFFVSNAQHLLMITAAAWIPHVAVHFLIMCKRLRIVDVLITSIYMCLMILGGYPFITIVLFYFLLLFLLVLFFKKIMNKEWIFVQRMIILLLLLSAIVFVLCIPLIISLIQVFPVFERGSSLTADIAVSYPFTFKALLFNLVPFALVSNWEFFGTDISMVNIYIGIIPSIFFVYGMSKKAPSWQYTAMGFGLFCLCASFAKDLPLMKFLVRVFPLLDYFRFPALLRLFFMFTVMLFSLHGMECFVKERKKINKKIIGIILAFAVVLIGFIISSALKIDFKNLSFLKSHASFSELLSGITFNEQIFLGAMKQVFFLFVFLVLIWKSKRDYSATRNIAVLTMIELFISVQMNINYTVVDPGVNPIKTDRALEAIIPNGFPIPKRTSMVNAKNEGTGIFGIWRNINIFTKNPAIDGFSSFWLNDYLLLEKDTMLGKQVLDNPIVYLSSSVFSYSDLKLHKENGKIKRKNIYLSDADYYPLQFLHLNHSGTDTAYFLQFGPNKFRIKVISSGLQILTLLQSNYKGWNVSISGKEANWFKSNYLFMSVLIPKGEYEVVFKYENLWIKYNFFIAASVFFLVLMIILFLTIKERNKPY